MTKTKTGSKDELKKVMDSKEFKDALAVHDGELMAKDGRLLLRLDLSDSDGTGAVINLSGDTGKGTLSSETGGVSK